MRASVSCKEGREGEIEWEGRKKKERGIVIRERV